MEAINIYLLLLIILSVVLMACLVILARSYLRLLDRNKSLVETVSNLGELNDRLRMDRHDYLNQLQIVYGLMELEEYDEMNSYLRKVYKELLKTGKAIKTSKPAINALLAAKYAECDAKGIEMVIDVKSDLKDIKIEDWELCKVLSNLTDNAIRALVDSEVSEKRIRVNITETKDKYIFDVENNGPEIPDEIREHIFKKGFTTKKGEGHGMGLAIVSKILEESGGDIKLETEEGKTVFTVELKKL
ncbi:sensor histidine kinase [Butyrivibrio sp. VCD2006]|uniref:sensor histidine kinase n=1 Tax=Butyrivibrio sp. VCD2006 TaxID=1280664 RepID=UPI0012DECC3F|nr:ATP-binding protein [Butyrivibrio sp. VCD2006]